MSTLEHSSAEAGPSQPRTGIDPPAERRGTEVSQDGADEETQRVQEVLSLHRRVATSFTRNKAEREAAKNWDKFYKVHQDRFFQDKNWTGKEFEELRKATSKATGGGTDVEDEDAEGDKAELQSHLTASGQEEQVLLEVGCGPGALLFPAIQRNPNLKAFACDFSSRAVDLVKSNPNFDPSRIHAFVHDLTNTDASPLTSSSDAPPPDVLSLELSAHAFASPVRTVTLFFVLSAVPPSSHLKVLLSLSRALPLGGTLLFRDFAYGDLAQLRFHTRSSAAWTEPALLTQDGNLYRRGDGTMTYFFTLQELKDVAKAAGLEGSVEIIKRDGLNRKTGQQLPRRFIQARLLKVCHA